MKWNWVVEENDYLNIDILSLEALCSILADLFIIGVQDVVSTLDHSDCDIFTLQFGEEQKDVFIHKVTQFRSKLHLYINIYIYIYK